MRVELEIHEDVRFIRVRWDGAGYWSHDSFQIMNVIRPFELVSVVEENLVCSVRQGSTVGLVVGATADLQPTMLLQGTHVG
jgi:hypothetical protein